MARTIAEIKNEMATAFMAESAVQERYGFTSRDSFDSKFSKVSIEGLLLYVVAFGIWVLEKLMDSHTEEVEAALAEKSPHTTRWYRNLVQAFQPSWSEEPPVKYCSVDDRGARLKVKVAAGDAGDRKPIESEAKAALENYLAEEKDAGLKIEVINEDSCQMKAALTVWYDPIELVPSGKPVETALKEYVSNLDFDGLLSRNGIIDALRGVSGVEMVRIDSLTVRYAENAWREFGEQERAESGYWSIASDNITVVYNRYTRANL